MTEKHKTSLKRGLVFYKSVYIVYQ